jgi:glutamine synthetase
MLMALIDGIQNKIDPGKPLDRDIYHMSRAELDKTEKTPESLEQALASLRADHKFLLKGGVFTEDLIDTWINYKMENEVEALRLRPHPHEFFLYYDS